MPSDRPTSDDFLIGAAVMSSISNRGIFSVNQTIGDGPTSVNATIYDYTCDTVISDPLVTYSGDIYNGEYFIYGIDLDKEYLFESPLVTLDPDNELRGVLQFCIRVSTWVDVFEVTFRETNFNIFFDFSTLFSTLTYASSRSGLMEKLQQLGEEVATEYNVEACFCGSETFVCVSQTPTFSQNSLIQMCLFPTLNGQPSSDVTITNFDMSFQGSDKIYTYSPVQLGPTSWSENAVSEIQEGINSDDARTIKIVTPFVAQLFDEVDPGNTYTVPISGSAILAFNEDSEQANTFDFSLYSLEADVVVADEKRDCLSRFRKALIRFLP